MSALFNGFTRFAEVFAAFKFSGKIDEFITCLAEAFGFANALFIPRFQLMFGET
jgi:hypothetical protein